MKSHTQRRIILFVLVCSTFFSRAQTSDVYTSSATWTVPVGVTFITIKVYGGGGGTGGQDCGAGCSNAASGNVGYVLATYNVSSGDVIGIYPGGKGVNGTNNASATGGGNGGVASYSTSYNGGKGGNAGASGSSGGGGGGGAASVVTINSVIKIVAGGAGGGGGMANMAGSGSAGNASVSANGTSNAGGVGTTPGGDGGGGGGGGGGQYGSVGGGVHAAGGESAGDGGFRGNNSVAGAASVTTNGSIAWTISGQIEITYTSTLPATWLSFTVEKENNTVSLNWITATEINTKNYTVQHSGDGIDWRTIGIVAAAGNSSSIQHYTFVDQNATGGVHHYRLLQTDMDDKINYSKIVSIKLEAEQQLHIYPNPPRNGTVTIALSHPSTIEIYNSVGTKMMEKEFSSGGNQLKISQLPKGTYYVKTKDSAAVMIIQ